MGSNILYSIGLSKLFLKFLHKIRSLIKKAHETYPNAYFNLTLESNILTVNRLYGNKVIEKICYDVMLDSSEDFVGFLKKHSHYPLDILLKNEESKYYVVSTKTVKWWNKSSFFKEIQEGEFGSSPLIQIQSFPSQEDPNRYLLIGVNPSKFLQNLIQSLQQLPNPILGIRLWAVVFAKWVFENFTESKLQKNPMSWVIILYQSENVWYLISCHDQAVVLTRHGYIDNTRSLEINLEQEVLSTLNYLGREGYSRESPVVVLQIGQGEELSFEQAPYINFFKIKKDFNQINELSIGPSFWKSIKGKLNRDHKPHLVSFNPKGLYSHRLAWKVAKWLMDLVVPFVVFILGISSIFFIFNLRLQQNYIRLLERNISFNELLINKNNHEIGELFSVYQTIKSATPIPGLIQLSKILSPFGVITEMSWEVDKPGSFVQVARINGSLTINKNLLSKGDSFEENLVKYQKQIKEELSKIDPKRSIRWGSLSNKSELVFNIQYNPLVKN